MSLDIVWLKTLCLINNPRLITTIFMTERVQQHYFIGKVFAYNDPFKENAVGILSL